MEPRDPTDELIESLRAGTSPPWEHPELSGPFDAATSVKHFGFDLFELDPKFEEISLRIEAAKRDLASCHGFFTTRRRELLEQILESAESTAQIARQYALMEIRRDSAHERTRCLRLRRDLFDLYDKGLITHKEISDSDLCDILTASRGLAVEDPEYFDEEVRSIERILAQRARMS